MSGDPHHDLPTWVAVLGRLDDETLSTWSSAGNLRRAARELEEGRVVLDGSGAILRFSVDDATCTWKDADLSHARCTCPAGTACRHLLACLLWMRNDRRGTDAPHQVATDDALDRMCLLDPEAILGDLTPSQRRKALELVRDPHWELLPRTPGSVGVRHLRKGWESRWTPDERFGKTVSNVSAAQAPQAHAAAILWVLHARAGWIPEFPAKIALPDPIPAELHVLLGQILDRGVSQAGSHFSSRLELLATQVRAQGRKPLAARMRDLAGILEGMGPSGTSTQEALQVLGRVLGAIESASPPSTAIDATVDRMEAISLGAHWWEARGGSRGATALFFELATGRLRTLALARADHRDVRFGRETLWGGQLVWRGASLDTLQGRILDIRNLSVRPDGSWKVSEATRVDVSTWPDAEDALWKSLGSFHWEEVRLRIHALAGSLGLENAPVVLRPAQMGTPFLVDASGEFRWEILDAQGRKMTLHLPPDSWSLLRRERLAEFLLGGAGRVRAVVTYARRLGMRIVLEPTSLLLDLGGRMMAWSPDFQVPPHIQGSALVRWFRNLRAKPESPLEKLAVLDLHESSPPARQALEPLLELCEEWAEGGRKARPNPENFGRIAQELEHRGFLRLAGRIAHAARSKDDLEAVRLHLMARTLSELEDWS